MLLFFQVQSVRKKREKGREIYLLKEKDGGSVTPKKREAVLLWKKCR